MTNRKSPGMLRRMLQALGAALERALLGRSAHGHMKQFDGSDEYWDSAIAARQGWPVNQPPEPAPNRDRTSGAVEFEPVYGWTRRQLDDYLNRNPGYRATYEAQLQHGGTPGLASVAKAPRTAGAAQRRTAETANTGGPTASAQPGRAASGSPASLKEGVSHVGAG